MTTGPAPGALTEPDALAQELFGDALPSLRLYAGLLAADGVQHGLIGPREVPRLWDRHLVNCGLLAQLLASNSVVADVGSGAGLPGIVLALMRPDLRIVLIESMQRRVEFLSRATRELGLESSTSVVHGRAEAAVVVRQVRPVDAVVARAVAPLLRLVEWSMPLLKSGGELLALKGESVASEAATVPGARVVTLDFGDSQTWVARVVKGRQ